MDESVSMSNEAKMRTICDDWGVVEVYQMDDNDISTSSRRHAMLLMPDGKWYHATFFGGMNGVPRARLFGEGIEADSGVLANLVRLQGIAARDLRNAQAAVKCVETKVDEIGILINREQARINTEK